MGVEREGVEPSYGLRRHQRLALDAIDAAQRRGRRLGWVVLPPGAGKTLVGVETARRRGRPTVVLCPNTAIQGQWLRAWPGDAGTSRELTAELTALTYQSLATFDDDADDRGTADLHPNGQALVVRLRELGDVTLVLDECHHLLEVWGRLVRELLETLPDAFVLGLTATPARTLTRDQARLVDELFGAPLVDVSIPAVVREGDLAPYADLAWLTTPTPTERDWLAAQGERFAELTTALSDPAYGSISFFTWLDQEYAGPETPWLTLSVEEPELTDAVLRMVHAGLARLPPGARLVERHRHDPTAADWVLLIDGWTGALWATGRDDDVLERIRAVLPSIGYTLTARGVRRGRTTVDRVLARSEAKAQALTEIVAAEHRNLGERLRQLVLCDHERATATLSADLDGLLDQQAGSALLALDHLVTELPDLHPLLVTGTTVAGADATLERLRAHAARSDLEVADGRLTGSWTSRDWVPAVTRFFEAGHCQVLVGTRDLLGEGWDARAITGLVDLTTATTSTGVVHTCGRALRTDPAWPDKVALTWSVVCVSEEHPGGAADWERFVRRHDGFLAIDEEGEVVAGVPHVSAAFSPYAPPRAVDFDTVNAAMLVRSEQREQLRDAWAVGTGYEDELVHSVRVRGGPPPRPAPVPVVIRGRRIRTRDRRPAPWRPHPVVLAGAVLAVVVFLLNLTPAVVVALFVAVLLGVQTTVAVDRGGRLAEELVRPPSIEQVASAVADGLHAVGLSPVGAEAVEVSVHHGEHRCVVTGVEPRVSATFATALDEVVSPLLSPRYVVPRWTLVGPADNSHGVRAALGVLRPDGEVWHTVPSVLATTGTRAGAFAAAWDHWVGGGAALYTGSPEGEGVLVTHRGSDPFSVTTVLRTAWR